MVYHSKGIRSSPHSAPSATASKESFPFRTNTDPMPTIYRLHKTDQFRTVGKCTGIQWYPRHFFASNMGSIQCLSAYTAHSAMIHPFSPNMNLMTRCEKRISVHHKAQHIFCLHTRFREDTSRSYAERPFPSRAHLPSSGFICISQCILYSFPYSNFLRTKETKMV